MDTLTWAEAQKLKELCLLMVKDVNQAFRKSGQQIVCLLIAPVDAEGMQTFFSKFLIAKDEDYDQQFSQCEECCVVAVIKDESNADKPYYYYKILENILAYVHETD